MWTGRMGWNGMCFARVSDVWKLFRIDHGKKETEIYTGWGTDQIMLNAETHRSCKNIFIAQFKPKISILLMFCSEVIWGTDPKSVCYNTVDGGWCAASLEKQTRGPAWKLRNVFLWTGTATKHIYAPKKINQYQLKRTLHLEYFDCLTWCQTALLMGTEAVISLSPLFNILSRRTQDAGLKSMLITEEEGLSCQYASSALLDE